MKKKIDNSVLLVIYALILMLTQSCKQDVAKGSITSGARSEGQPNIVIVLIDDLRWDELGITGHNYIKTPNIDLMAKEGAYFKNAFTPMPLCSPSRAGILTGMYAHANGITDNTARNKQSHMLRTFPGKLDSLGYETAFIGKWHMGNDDSRRPGFNYWVALKGQGESNDPKLNINGERKVVEGYTTDVLTDFALDFISTERDEPFLLYLSHKALHPNISQDDNGTVADIGDGGFVAAERHKGMYAGKVFNKRNNFGVTPSDKPALMRKINDLPDLSEETATSEKTIVGRAEMLMAVDEGLGRIVDLLRIRRELDHTVIVVLSDHGYFYGEHGLDVERRLAYEENIRIPMFIRYPPKIKAGSTINQTVLTIDVAPTLISLAGQKVDDHIQGRSLVPLFENSSEDWRNSFLIEYYSDKVWERIVTMGYKAVRNDKYKFIHYVDLDGMDELYDLENDPYELNNIINQSETATILDDMKKLVNEHLIDTGDHPITDW